MNNVHTLLLSLILAAACFAEDLILSPPFDTRNMEYSGMDWYGDRLVLLPQYPRGALVTIDAKALQEALRSGTALHPERLPFDDRNATTAISGSEGYEAIAFHGDAVYLLIEAHGRHGKTMQSHLCLGHVGPKGVTLEQCIEIPLPLQIRNYSHEALAVTKKGLLVIYEANGTGEATQAYRVAFDLSTVDPIPMAPVDFRVTDATRIVGGTLWVTTPYWIPESLRLKQFRLTNRALLVELAVTQQSVVQTGRQVVINDGMRSYNWEGVVRFAEGFVIVTDAFPGSVLRYLPGAGSGE
jgi:hypothetical protein